MTFFCLARRLPGACRRVVHGGAALLEALVACGLAASGAEAALFGNLLANRGQLAALGGGKMDLVRRGGAWDGWVKGPFEAASFQLPVPRHMGRARPLKTRLFAPP